MRRIRVIGIGAGDPDYVTMQAVNALNEVDVFFVTDKGDDKDDLLELREQILQRFVRPDRSYDVVPIADPPRDRTTPAYQSAVEDWHDKRAVLFEQAIANHLGADGVGAFLVWGDPSLYDSTLRVIERILARRVVSFDYDVIPGITSVQALAARHRLLLNRIGEPVHITTGRRLAAGFPDNLDAVVVMLDADLACRDFTDPDLHIYWGAYVGTPDEALRSGRLIDVADEIVRTRAEAKQRKGWIMDSYLLRREPD